MLARLLVLFLLCFPLVAAQTSGVERLDNQAIVTMVKAGLSEEIVLAKIRSTPANFDVSAQALADLKKNGVSERVIMAMMETANPQLRQAPRPAATPTPAQTATAAPIPRPQPARTPPPYVASSSSYGDDEIERGIVFGGLAYSRGDLHANFVGWNAALSTALTDRLALKSDFSGVYTTVDNGLVDYSLYSFAVGPEFRARRETVNVFAHAMVGLARTGAALNFRNAGDNNAEFIFGGGLDFGLSPSFGIRFLQGDYQLIRAGGESVHMARLSAGALFRF